MKWLKVESFWIEGGVGAYFVLCLTSDVPKSHRYYFSAFSIVILVTCHLIYSVFSGIMDQNHSVLKYFAFIFIRYVSL